MAAGNIKVVVRCRPLNSREIKRGAKSLVRMEDGQTILDPPETAGNKDVDPGARAGRAIEKKPHVFSFDKSYWSAGPRDEPRYASQQTLYEDLGVDLLDHSFQGFNTCIIAYGQTGSGKSYSMMGYGADKGIIPLTTMELFKRVAQKQSQDPKLSYTVEVSYIEIYNEKVRDLLNPSNKSNLRVREHPSLGPYVEDLSRLVVENYEGMLTLMDEGNKARTVASTNMNETSSRSHAVFTLVLTQKRRDEMTGMDGEKVSKISLVDLAGSERANSTGATGARLKEGANINKSLTTLGKVIAALAQASAEPVKGRKRKDDFVPYRDSVLTWLLKESLGGNSMTAVIAAISPADYEETLSTLRYADAAKQIKTHAVVNEDPNAKLIRELKEELEVLRARASGITGTEEAFDPTIPPEKQIVTYYTKDGELRKVNKLELQDQLQASEKLMESLNLTWEEKLEKTRAIHVEREKALEELGITVDKNVVGLHAPQNHPSLVNLNEDPLMSECLVYQIKSGRTIVGSLGAGAHIKLTGSHILTEHCVFENVDGRVTLEAMPDSLTMVNGKRIPPRSPVTLRSGYRVILGDFHVFRFNDPAAVRKQREIEQASPAKIHDEGARSRADSPFAGPDLMDWTAARREAADFNKLGDQDLDRLFDDIVKVRTLRRRPESRSGPPESWTEDNPQKLSTATYTEDTTDLSTNPWGAPSSSMTSASTSIPHFAEVLQKSDHDGLKTTASGGAATKLMDDVTMEQRHMEKQLRHIAGEMKRLRSQAMTKALEQIEPFEPVVFSARRLEQLHGVLAKWKQLRSFAVAEEILTGAVEIKEANVLAAELGKLVRYNFTLFPSRKNMPVSVADNRTDLSGLENEAGPQTTPDNVPTLMIMVLDHQAPSVYMWSLFKFRQQLAKMRSAQSMVKQPSYSQHFPVDSAFGDLPPPSFSLVGSARACLSPLLRGISATLQIAINCPYTMEALGSCRVTLRLADVTDSSHSSGRGTPDSRRPFSPAPSSELSVGSKLSFTITIDHVCGLSADDFADVHIQLNLSALAGAEVSNDETFSSQPVNLGASSLARLSLRRPVSLLVIPSLLAHLRDGLATIDFFARPNSGFLGRLERWQEQREASQRSDSGSSSPKEDVSPAIDKPVKPAMRRCETDFVQDEHHDVVAWVEVRELGASGQYVPAEVSVASPSDPGVFSLRQGLQRRVHLTLSHTSGRALPVARISHLKLSSLRLLDSSGKISEIVSRAEVGVRMPTGEQDVEYMTDGTARLTTSGVWDSSAHDSILLNRRTSADQTVVAKMSWLVELETTDEPAAFSMDVRLRIIDRDARSTSRLMSIFSSAKVLQKTSTIFALTLSPPMTRSARDLWRLDTVRLHVKGEEALGSWKPRGVSLLDDFGRQRRLSRMQAEVQATNAFLDWPGMPLADDLASRSDAADCTTLLSKCVRLWQSQISHSTERQFLRESPEEAAIARRLRKLHPDLTPKLVPTVKRLPRTTTVTKAGYLHILKDSPSNIWLRQYFTLRRPFLHLYETNSERNETGVINLASCSVTLSPDVEMLLERRFAFTVFTPSNSYILHAASAKEMSDWVQALSTTGGNLGLVR